MGILYIMDNGKIYNQMDMGSKFGKMETNMKVIGSTEKLMVKENLFIQKMNIFREISWIIRQMVMGFLHNQMALNMKEN